MPSTSRRKPPWEEGIALGLLAELDDPAPPVNAFSLAKACGLRVQAASISGARLIGDVIEQNVCVRPKRQHGLIAHELGHQALQRLGEPDTEGAASCVRAALTLPQREFSSDPRATRWALRDLRARHVHCSA